MTSFKHEINFTSSPVKAGMAARQDGTSQLCHISRTCFFLKEKNCLSETW